MEKKAEGKYQEDVEGTSGLENASRRKAVKTIVGGVTAIAAYNVLPSKWGTPVIEQIFLPAHAATSGSSLSDPCTVTIVSGNQSSGTVVVRVDGYVTPPTANLPTTIVVTPDGAGSPVTANTTTSADGTFSDEVTLTEGPGITRVNAVTTVEGAAGSASCGVDVPRQVWINEGLTITRVSSLCHPIISMSFVVRVSGSVSPGTAGLPIDINITVDSTNEEYPARPLSQSIIATTDSGGNYTVDFNFSGAFNSTTVTATATPGSNEVGGSATDTQSVHVDRSSCYV